MSDARDKLLKLWEARNWWRKKPTPKMAHHVRRFILQYPELENEIYCAGATIVAKRHRKALRRALLDTVAARERSRKHSDEFRERYNAIVAEQADIEDKAASFDKIVEMLDHMHVGTKALGDCSRGDLLREARMMNSTIEDVARRRDFYLALSETIGNKTVRQAADRAKVISLLNAAFRSV